MVFSIAFAVVVLSEMGKEGALSAEEHERMVLGVYYRHRNDILEPSKMTGNSRN